MSRHLGLVGGSSRPNVVPPKKPIKYWFRHLNPAFGQRRVTFGIAGELILTDRFKFLIQERHFRRTRSAFGRSEFGTKMAVKLAGAR